MCNIAGTIPGIVTPIFIRVGILLIGNDGVTIIYMKNDGVTILYMRKDRVTIPRVIQVQQILTQL